MKIEEIEQMGIAGDAYHDQHIFNACHDYIVDETNLIADRLRALKKIDVTMGVESEPTEADIREYIECTT